MSDHPTSRLCASGRWPRPPTGFSPVGDRALTTALEAETHMKLTDLRTKIFADGAELAGMLAMYREPHIKGFTTNPTLMRKAGIADYRAFAQRGARRDSRSADLVRGVLRRVRRHGAAGARDRHVGRARLREDSGHQHPSRARLRPGAPAVARRREAERHGDDDARAGAGASSTRSRAARRRTSRCSPAASPTPAATRCRT